MATGAVPLPVRQCLLLFVLQLRKDLCDFDHTSVKKFPVPLPLLQSRIDRKASVAFVLITLGIDAFGVGVAIPVMPELVRQLSRHQSVSAPIWVAMLVSGYAFAQFLMAPILGGLSDRFGRRRVILLSVCGICLNYILLAVAPTLGWILFGRLMAGATAANVSCSTAYIADVTPPEQRAARFGLVSATFGLGFVLGPAVGGLIGGHSLRAPFVLSAVMCGLNVIYGFFVLPESLPPAMRRPFSWRRANPVGTLGVIGDDRYLRLLAMAWAGLWVGISTLQSVFVLYMGIRFGWHTAQNGLALAIVGSAQALIQSFGVKRLVQRFGEWRTAMMGCGFACVAYLLYAVAPVVWLVFPCLLLQAIGSIAPPAIQAMVSRRVGPLRQGETQGALSSVGGLTQFMAPLVAGAALNFGTAPHSPIHFAGLPWLIGACAYAAAMLCIRLSQRWTQTASAGEPAAS